MVSFKKVIKKVAGLFNHQRSKTFVQVCSTIEEHQTTPVPSFNPSLISLSSLESLIQIGPASSPNSFPQFSSCTTKLISGAALFPLDLIPTLVIPAGSNLSDDVRPVVPGPEITRLRRCPEFAAPLGVGKDGRMKGLSDLGACQEAGRYAVKEKKMEYRGGRHFPSSPPSISTSSSSSSLRSTTSSRPSTASSTSTAPPPEPQPLYQTPTFCTSIPIILTLETPEHFDLPVTKIYNVGEVIRSVRTRRDAVIVYC